MQVIQQKLLHETRLQIVVLCSLMQPVIMAMLKLNAVRLIKLLSIFCLFQHVVLCSLMQPVIMAMLKLNAVRLTKLLSLFCLFQQT